jgi:predicted lipid-binding transport protein (Tim44 family)
MTEAEQPKPIENAEAKASAPDRGKLLRGCGCLAGLCVLGLGILIIGNFDHTAWASSIIAIVIGFLTFQLSGINGMWDDK